MKEKHLKILSYCYLIIPIIIFALGWTKLWVSIPVVICLAIIIIKKWFDSKNDINGQRCFISKSKIIIIFLITLLICITAGQGGLFYQSNDWNWRNAVFRDLINFDWPVYYEENNTGLTYYIGIWLVPALIGKAMTQIYEPIAWQVANIALGVWCSIGVLIAILWLLKLLEIKEKKSIVIAVFVFLGFSGLDIVGILLTRYFNLHIEWWAKYFQYSSIITQLFWVFNQAIIAWITTMMFLDEEKVENYLLIVLLCLPYCPLPFLGLIPLVGANGISILIKSIKNNQLKKFFKDVFSIQNVLGFISIFPLYLLYYGGNSSVGGTGGFGINILVFLKINILLVFWFLEVGIYYLLLYKDNKENVIFATSAILLLLIPLFKIGTGSDFVMRASIPSLIILIYYLIKGILKNIAKINMNAILIVTVFIIGLITPMLEYGRAIYVVVKSGKINCVADNIKTFSDKSPDELLLSNFLTVNPKETSIFYKYIARK